MTTIMTIAGFDPSGGAGIMADTKTICALGGNPVGVVTSVTAQNDSTFHRCVPVSAERVIDQINAVVEYYKVDAVKVGMLYSRENVTAVSKAIVRNKMKNIVLDPLIESSTGKALIEYDIAMLKNELFPHVSLLTPNISEAAKLYGRSIVSLDDVKEAAVELTASSAGAIVITGFMDATHSIDLLYDGSDFSVLKKSKIDTVDLHGTGCTFSSAAALFLAHGEALSEAVKLAKGFTYNAIKHATEVEPGKWILNHFHSG